MVNLWKGETIFTFSDNSLEAGLGSDGIINKKGRSTIEPNPFALSSDEPTRLPRQNPSAIVQARRVEEAPPPASSHEYRPISIQSASVSKIDIHFLIRFVVSAKISRQQNKKRVDFERAFGDMTFTDHCQVPRGTGEHIIVFVILDGAATSLTAEAVNTTQEVEYLIKFS